MVYRSARFSYVLRSLEESKRSIWDLDWSSDCGQRLDGFMLVMLGKAKSRARCELRFAISDACWVALPMVESSRYHRG